MYPMYGTHALTPMYLGRIHICVCGRCVIGALTVLVVVVFPWTSRAMRVVTAPKRHSL